MNSYLDVIDAFGGSAALARALGEAGGTVRQWRQRDRVPSRYWTRIVRAAQERDIEFVTLEALALLAHGREPAAHAPSRTLAGPASGTESGRGSLAVERDGA